ncbi:2,3-bisphosphoglycerate-independent phosphoglycerate mutase [Parasporobacterium paucivorans]|uniref:2,3-bisphosphoglycerate-independent phosphoglycerate mutase n=1 Tax=Parasporobacterium paucivorans DSM 15970 TaxID=1122934 RepID=A0A1M6DMI4_9FIRM|nr:2,3-bisphosphoglycerate-independent phosphoglycerate mutase [Parasporobacterium paucivorans]SHI74380.1 phosphoglycerate mutase [Parasporobacterium paucivorans DSM 15970]
MKSKPVVLMILDGFGLAENKKTDFPERTDTPEIDKLMKTYPFVKGYASGKAVGLPEGQMGNSEVGHLNIGAGRVIYQDLTKITKEIDEGSFFETPELLEAIDNCKRKGSNLHLMGLLSDGGVHSHNTHVYALLELAKRENFDRVFIHVFLDGRDTSPSSGISFVRELEEKTVELGTGRIATVMGRYYSMDRDNRWDRVKLAYDALALGAGIPDVSAAEAVEKSYNAGVTDEFVKPVIIWENGKPLASIRDDDSVIFFNFRPDRARELTRAFCDEEFSEFERAARVRTTYVCFTDYDVTIQNKLVAFKDKDITNTFGELLAENHLKQLRLAETEKYAHVTFFFNGGKEVPNEGEDRILISSPKVATYDLQPEMSAVQVCDALVEAVQSNVYDVIIVNFANPDMVGHTGVQSAVWKALKTVDICVKRAFDSIKEAGGILFICADHGNAEKMIDEKTGECFTAHTTNPVPFILCNANPTYKLAEGGALCDIAPTLIDLMGLEKPEEMTGRSLLVR